MGNSSDGLLPKHSADIIAIDRLITTICEHIVPGKSLPRGCIAVRIDKPSPNRVIVPPAEVVQARFGVIDVPTIAQGVRSAEGGGHGAAGVHKTGNVEIPVAVVRHGRRANGVVGKMQLVAAPCHVRQPGYLFLLVGFLVLQVGRYFPAPQAFKLHAFLARQ